MTRKEISYKLRKCLETYARKTKKFKPDLGCMCAISSFVMHDIFREYGYKSEVWWGGVPDFGGFHCWVRSNGKNYDLTLTQFKEKDKVVISKDLRIEIIDPCRANLEDLINWPDYQYPKASVIKKIKKLFKETK